ncbi:MAG: ComF family protein, partial [Actinomycetota bacterium]
RGELRRAVHQMKFRNARWIAARFGRNLATALRTQGDGWQPDIVTWAPTTARRIRLRGVDQSVVIATNLARRLGVRRVRLLRRIDDRTQTGASRASRQRGPQYVVRTNGARGRRILLVDDVMTTGTTLARAREALLAAGASEVRCAVIAHVMRQNSPGSARVG